MKYQIIISYVVKLIEEVRARWRISQRKIVYQKCRPTGLFPVQSGIFEFVVGAGWVGWWSHQELSKLLELLINN